MDHRVLQDVQISFGRCLTDPRFFDRFCEIFMGSHPDIGPMFAKTDMPKQKHLLRHGLMSALMFAEDDAMARMCIDRIRDSHNQTRPSPPTSTTTGSATSCGRLRRLNGNSRSGSGNCGGRR